MTDRNYVEIDLRNLLSLFFRVRLHITLLIITDRHYKEINLRCLLFLRFRVWLHITT